MKGPNIISPTMNQIKAKLNNDKISLYISQNGKNKKSIQ